MMFEHATDPRRREETLPEPFVPDLRRQVSQGLCGSGEHLLQVYQGLVSFPKTAEFGS